MTRPFLARALAVCVVVVLLVACWSLVRRHVAADAVLAEQVRARDSVLAVEQHRADSVSRLVRVRVDTFRVLETRWRTQRDTVLRLDSLLIEHRVTDTVRVPVTVLVTADSAIRACSRALDVTQTACAMKDTLIRSLRSQLAAVERQRPSRWRAISERALWGLAGYGLGRVVR